jgi:FKBP-type peptidyl-prolyl cis-trans isomerase
VIQGWEEAFLHMKKGEKATIYIPSALGYGDRDMQSIPANSVLIFDVEVVK